MRAPFSSHIHRFTIFGAAALAALFALPSFAQGKYEPGGDAVYHGAGLPDYWSENGLRQQVNRYKQVSGKNLAIITWFASLYENGSMTSWPQNYAPNLARIKRMGDVSLIKFSTSDSNYNGTKKIASPPDVARGIYDAYFNQFADTVKQFGDPVFISINHEMNGNWYPYSQDYPGTNYTAADYVAMWKHIVGVFRARGANNVAWVWAPNVPDLNGVPADAYYPGDAYVDWIGPSFYSGNQMNAMDKLYRTYSPRKPFFITEWATSSQQNKYNAAFPGEAQWVAGFFEALQQRYPRVKAISWFEWNKDDGDHRLERVSGQQQTYAAEVKDARYLGDASGLISPPPGGVVAPRREVVPREIILPDRTTTQRTPVQRVPVQNAPAPAPVQTAPSGGSLRDRLKLTVTPRQNVAVQR